MRVLENNGVLIGVVVEMGDSCVVVQQWVGQGMSANEVVSARVVQR